MKPCRPLRQGDQMQCHCGLAWDISEEKPTCSNDKPEISEQLPLIETESNCRYCDGSGFFYSEPDLGPRVCKVDDNELIHVKNES